MSLANDIMALVDQPTAWAIRAAPRFVVSREVVVCAEAVVKLPMASQLRALAVRRLPFATCWIKWSTGDGYRVGALRAH